MDFKNFSDLREFSRRYNSTTMLEIGSSKCWGKWKQSDYSNPLEWIHSNTDRQYTIRLMLLASLSNPHRHGQLNIQSFNDLVNAYHNLGGHTISDPAVLHKEAEILLDSIVKLENEKQKDIRNWSLKLSSTLSLETLKGNMIGFFVQRLGSFQNSGFGKPSARISRISKILYFLNEQDQNYFSNVLSDSLGLSVENYFWQYVFCLGLFGEISKKIGFLNIHRFPEFSSDIQDMGITEDNIKFFIRQNSTSFSTDEAQSFRRRVTYDLERLPVYYQPFLYNFFLTTPIVKLNDNEFCLPDPFSFIDSAWNQIGIITKELSQKKVNIALSSAFELYIEKILLPAINSISFQKIPEVENPTSRNDKRADFLIETTDSYILLECKNSLMAADTSVYFQAEKIGDLWFRIHAATEQIRSTVEAMNLNKKPVIPVIITFYDCTAAAAVLREILNQTDYCSQMKISVPPVVHSLHEFEHFISSRSLSNWSKLMLEKQNPGGFIEPDNQGHGYRHLVGFSII